MDSFSHISIIIMNNYMHRSYGEMILQSGTVMYHSSRTPFVLNLEKPMLFTTFHPSEWVGEYTSKILLKKDVSLFFMIDGFKKNRPAVLPLLNKLIEDGSDLSKMYDENLQCYIDYLNSEKFNGWFSTIEGGNSVEVSLINSPGLFQVISSEKTVTDWSGSTYDDSMNVIPKDWGKNYPISTLKHPASLILNRRYKAILEQYIKDIKTSDPNGTCIEIVLSNARITYFDAPKEIIKWKCPKTGGSKSKKTGKHKTGWKKTKTTRKHKR